MVDPKEIDNGIAAHGAWKDRLKTAVDTGKLEIPVATISADNQCAFGKWLYGSTLSGVDKASPQYAEIKQLHADFHKVAGRIAQLATSGKKTEAQQMLDFGKDYTMISGKLALALQRWKESVGQAAPVR